MWFKKLSLHHTDPKYRLTILPANASTKNAHYKKHKIVILLLLFRYFSVNSFLQFVYFEIVLKSQQNFPITCLKK